MSEKREADAKYLRRRGRTVASNDGAVFIDPLQSRPDVRLCFKGARDEAECRHAWALFLATTSPERFPVHAQREADEKLDAYCARFGLAVPERPDASETLPLLPDLPDPYDPPEDDSRYGGPLPLTHGDEGEPDEPAIAK